MSRYLKEGPHGRWRVVDEKGIELSPISAQAAELILSDFTTLTDENANLRKTVDGLIPHKKLETENKGMREALEDIAGIKPSALSGPGMSAEIIARAALAAEGEGEDGS